MRKFSLILMLCVACASLLRESKSIYDFTMKSIDGQPVSLGSYSGKVVLLVNVASKCGFTPQYAGLEALYEKYKDRGLVIVGIPANNFMQQEPGTNEEIKKFCSSKYNVTFPMMAKVSVLGDDQTPLYTFLTGKSPTRNSAATSSGTSPSFSSTATASRWRASSPLPLPTRPKLPPPLKPRSGSSRQSVKLHRARNRVPHCRHGRAMASHSLGSVSCGLRCLSWPSARLFISCSSFTSRSNPCSRAVLLPGTVLAGSSPARMKPWPAPS